MFVHDVQADFVGQIRLVALESGHGSTIERSDDRTATEILGIDTPGGLSLEIEFTPFYRPTSFVCEPNNITLEIVTNGFYVFSNIVRACVS